MESEKKKEKFSEKIKKGMRRAVLTAGIMASSLMPSYSAFSSFIIPPDPEDFQEYALELKILKDAPPAGIVAPQSVIETEIAKLKIARKLIIQKQEKRGRFKDIKLDYIRTLIEHHLARGPPQAEIAEKYIKTAVEMADENYKHWGHIAFLNIKIQTLKSGGNMYFYAAEEVKEGRAIIVTLKKPIRDYDYEENTKTDIVYGSEEVLKSIPQDIIKDKIIGKIYPLYLLKAKEYYEKCLEYLENEFRKKIEELEESQKEKWLNTYNKTKKEVTDNLEKINEDLKEEKSREK